MVTISMVCDIIILVAAVCVAITNIYKFFANSGKGVKDKIDSARQEQLQAEKTRTLETIAEVNKEQKEIRKTEIISVLEEQLPIFLLKHDLETREKYKRDREKYLEDIKKEVVREVGEQLSTIDHIQVDIEALADSAKDVLREKIMAMYHKNKRARELEEHEKEALTQYYKDYKAIGGNSYIDKYYGRMSTWSVIPDDYIDD